MYIKCINNNIFTSKGILIHYVGLRKNRVTSRLSDPINEVRRVMTVFNIFNVNIMILIYHIISLCSSLELFIPRAFY